MSQPYAFHENRAGNKTHGMKGKDAGWMVGLLSGWNGGWANRPTEEQMDTEKECFKKCNEEKEWLCLSQFELNLISL